MTGIVLWAQKRGVRNSQMDPDTVLKSTIWPLAAILVPCCKNPLRSKGLLYLGLSNHVSPGRES